MLRTLVRALPAASILISLWCGAQSPPVASPQPPQDSPHASGIPAGEPEVVKPTASLHLTPLEVVTSTELATTFLGPFICDGDGNLYLRSNAAGLTGIRKLNSKGERVVLIEPSANPDLSVGLIGYFTATQEGELYSLIFAADQPARFVMVFKNDGSYKSNIKLDPGFVWFPSAMSVFLNGNMLITGQRYDVDPKLPKLPFTGIFRSDGTLLKKLDLEDDDAIHAMGSAHDAKVTSTQVPGSNRAIALSQMQAASDGNIYLMRSLSPALFYAISPAGQVVRRFVVDPGQPAYIPFSMHISGNRIAVLFIDPQSMERVMKVVDLEGNVVASYDALAEKEKPTRGMLGLAFACYTQQPERFTFLASDDKHQILLQHAGAR